MEDVATLLALRAVKQANTGFIARCLRELFKPEVLPGEFNASAITRAAIERGFPEPSDWRITGVVVREAYKLGLIEKTGGISLRAKGPNAHTSRAYGPSWRVVRAPFKREDGR